MPGITWTRKPTDFIRDIERRADLIRARVGEIGDDTAKALEADAKAHHPWQNQTGEAERGLTGVCLKARDQVHIVLFNKAAHSVFLELARAGKYAIIRQTLLHALPTLERRLKDTLS